jgi:uncharacterized protein YjdB
MAGSPATITFAVNNVPAAATYPVIIASRSYGGNSANGSKVQNVTSSAGSSLTPTFAAASTWRIDTVNVSLTVGSNTIVISANWGYQDVDYIGVKGLGSSSSNTLTVSPSTLSLASTAGSGSITVTSNVSWTASSNQTWLTVSPASGSSNGTITATASANTGTSSRTAIVTVIGGSITQTVSVTQASATVLVTGVSVSPTTASLSVGGTTQLTATVAPSNATNKTVTYSSSNTSVATVSTSGLVTGVAAGSATITVTTQDGSKKATCSLTVTSGSLSYIGQAENGLLIGTTVSTASSGYSGTGYVTGFDNTGDMISIPFTVPGAGSYSIVVHYESLYDNKYNHLSVDSNYVGDLYWPKTTTWADLSIGTFTLRGGVNHVDILKDWGYIDVDYVKATLISLKSAEEVTDVAEINSSSISVYPNPAMDELKISGADESLKYNIISITGAQVLSGQGNVINVSGIKSGLYILKAGNQIVKFVKK